MSKILTPKGWRDLIIEKKKDFDVDIDMEPRVNNPFLVRTPSNREFISKADKHKEGFSTDVDFIHYHMGSNQKDHFDRDSEKVFPYMGTKKIYMVMSKYRNGDIEIMHHIRASSPLDAYNRYDHITMNPGTAGSEATRFRKEKKIPSGYKVVAHKQGNIKDVYRIAKRTISKL